MGIGYLFVIWSDFQQVFCLSIRRFRSFCYISLPTCWNLLICLANLVYIQIRCPVFQPGPFASVKDQWDKGNWKMTICHFIETYPLWTSLDSTWQGTRPYPQVPHTSMTLASSPVYLQCHSQTSLTRLSFGHPELLILHAPTLQMHTTNPLARLPFCLQCPSSCSLFLRPTLNVIPLGSSL